MVTFGGAYTTLPFIYAAAVQNAGWLSQRAFLDAIAITNMMPTPLVMFVTLVGYVGHGVGGTNVSLLVSYQRRHDSYKESQVLRCTVHTIRFSFCYGTNKHVIQWTNFLS